MWYIPPEEYRSATNEALAHATAWTDLEYIVLNEKTPDTKGRVVCYSIYMKRPE